MSEYQCYEFLALDRPLSKKQMAELRNISTRAEISPTRFWNEYDWGHLKADPAKLVERYFDAHLYFAIWGTHRLMLRIPAARVDAKGLRSYFVGDSAKARIAGAHLILDLRSEDEDRDDYEEEPAALAAVAPLRVELMHGDLRIAYLAWLLAVQSEEVAQKRAEPPVPPGLAELTAPQQAMVEFLRIDVDLLSAAAAGSGQISDDRPALLKWARGLASSAKDDWLRRAIEDPDFALGAELRRAFRTQAKPASALDRRTVAELLIAAEEHREQRERGQTKRADRAEKAARGVTKKRLDALAKQPDVVWAKLEALVEKKAHEEAIPLAVDLRDLAARDGVLESFNVRFQSMKKRQARCRAFFDRWKRANRPSEW